jgi:hypothetical protein
MTMSVDLLKDKVKEFFGYLEAWILLGIIRLLKSSG